MSNLAAQFLVAFALATQGAKAATTCAADYTAKTSVDDKYCSTDAKSCSMDPTCCTAPTPPKTCQTEVVTCDADSYNKKDATATGSDSKAACCIKKATCADATCTGTMVEDDTKGDALKCDGDAATCASMTCCKVKTGTCFAWNAAGNTCDAGKSIRLVDHAKTGSDKAACCTADVKCSTHTCPSATHELKVNAATSMCAQGTCDDSQCCQCKSTTCCGATITCGTNMYKDNAKNGVSFADKAKDCCTAQAQCKDSVLTDVSGAPVLSSFWSLLSVFSMLGLALRN